MAIWAIVPAAGVGRRLGGTIPKQYLPLLGRTVIERSVDCLLAIADIKCVVVAIGPQDTYWQDLPCSQHPHRGGHWGERASGVCAECASLYSR